MYVAVCSFLPDDSTDSPLTDCLDVDGSYYWTDADNLISFVELTTTDAMAILELSVLVFAIAFSFKAILKLIWP